MKKKTISFYGKTIAPGTQVAIDLPIERLPTHTMIDMPLHVVRGKKEGPVLLITAGLHGDEINGTEAIRRMIREKLLRPKAGTVVAMPIVNIYGFLHKSRSLPDGKDLNRSFPGSAKGSLARRLAYTLIEEVVTKADVIIDLHTGGAQRTNYPQVRCSFSRPASLELGKAFGAPFLLNSKEIPGSFRAAASRLNKQIVVYEGGESLRMDEYAIQEAIHGIQRLMQHLEMVPAGTVPLQESILLPDSTWIRAKTAGILRNFVEYGASVCKGDVLAHTGDPYGETIHQIKAPRDGYIIGLNNESVVNAGDALFNLAY